MSALGRFVVAGLVGAAAVTATGVARAADDPPTSTSTTSTSIPSTTTSTSVPPSTTSTTTTSVPPSTTSTTTTSTTTTLLPTLDELVGVDLTADRLTPAPRTATIISDSAMAGVRWNGALSGFQGFDADDRLESCRRLVALSCRGREGFAPLTVFSEISLMADAEPDDVLVIATGYNDWHESFDWQARMVLDAAQAKGFATIAWVTYRVDVTYELPVSEEVRSDYQSMNDELDVILESGEYPALRLWVLNGYTRWAGTWFYDDGVHERRRGSFGVADWISRHIAALDGRPCPMPWNLTIGQEQSCPNPDVLPFIRGYPDLTTLYGV